MTLQETGELCLFIRRTTHAWQKEDSGSFESIVRDWHECLKDVPYDLAKKSTIDYINTNSYQPTIADVRKLYHEQKEQQKELLLEYNNIYYSAIAHYPGYKDSEAERKEFDRITGYNRTKATRLSNKLIDYVRSCELAGKEMPTLEEWLKGVDSID